MKIATLFELLKQPINEATGYEYQHEWSKISIAFYHPACIRIPKAWEKSNLLDARQATQILQSPTPLIPADVINCTKVSFHLGDATNLYRINSSPNQL
jgi:hypothetical protein